MSADILAPLVRILLRWLGGMLVANGYLTDQGILADPELERTICFGLAALCGVVSEGWFYLARKYGWSR